MLKYMIHRERLDFTGSWLDTEKELEVENKYQDQIEGWDQDEDAAQNSDAEWLDDEGGSVSESDLSDNWQVDEF